MNLPILLIVTIRSINAINPVPAPTINETTKTAAPRVEAASCAMTPLTSTTPFKTT